MSLTDQVAGFIRRGIRVIQIREKCPDLKIWLEDAVRASDLAIRDGAFVIMNDRLDLALACACPGIHVGQEDLPPEVIKRLAPDIIVGLSCGSLDELEQAMANPFVDYTAIGPIFRTPLKEDTPPLGLDPIQNLRRKTKPLIAIGGIHLQNMDRVLQAGADMVAMIRGIAG